MSALHLLRGCGLLPTQESIERKLLHPYHHDLKRQGNEKEKRECVCVRARERERERERERKRGKKKREYKDAKRADRSYFALFNVRIEDSGHFPCCIAHLFWRRKVAWNCQPLQFTKGVACTQCSTANAAVTRTATRPSHLKTKPRNAFVRRVGGRLRWSGRR